MDMPLAQTENNRVFHIDARSALAWFALLFFLGAGSVVATPLTLDTAILPAPDSGGKWGYVDARTGAVLIAPQFSSADFFYNDVAIVSRNYPDREQAERAGVDAALTGAGVIARNGIELLPTIYARVEQAKSGQRAQSRLFKVRAENGEQAVYHTDKGFILPFGNYDRIQFRPGGVVISDGVYHALDGMRYTPPQGTEITQIEPLTNTLVVRRKVGIMKERGVFRMDGSVLVPIRYHDIKFIPEAEVWLASRVDPTVRRRLASAILADSDPDVGEGSDDLTVNVYDLSGEVVRSFRARYWPTVTKNRYRYTGKGVDYFVDAKTGRTLSKMQRRNPPDTADVYTIFETEERFGIQDADGTVRVQPVYGSIVSLGGGLFAATTTPEGQDRHHHNWGVIDATGREIIPPTYAFITATSETGPLICQRWHTFPRQTWLVERNGLHITPEDSPFEHDIRFNPAGLAVAQKSEGKLGVIDYYGHAVFPFGEYSQIHILFRGEEKEAGDAEEDVSRDAQPSVRAVKDAYFRVQQNGLWGLYDSAGRELVPLRYGFVSLSKERDDWAIVEDEKRNRSGFVHLRTGLTIAPRYQTARVYSGFLRVVERNPDARGSTYILFDGKGREFARYDAFREFRHTDMVAVKKDSRWALLDGMGKPVTPFRYTGITRAAASFVWGDTDKGRVLVGRNGKEYRIR